MRLIALLACSLAAYGQMQVVFPAPLPSSGFGNFALDASAEKWACAWTATKAGNIAKIRFQPGAVTSPGDARASFQDIDATTGNPDGTVDQYRVINVADTTSKLTGLVTSDGTDTGAVRTVAIGDRFMVVLDVDTYSAQNFTVRALSVNSATSYPFLGQNYCLHYTSGAWAKQTGAYPLFALEYSDGTYTYNAGSVFMSTISTLAFASNNATQDEVALRFTVPVTAKTSCGYFAVDFDAAATVRLYDGAGTVLGTATAGDSDIRVGTSDVMHMFCMPSEVTLSPGNTYRLAIEATTTTAIALRYFDVPAVAVLDQWDGGQAVYWDARVDGGSWTSTTTRRPIAGMILYGFTGGAGGSGGFAITQ